MIARAMASVACTMIGATMFGRMWRSTIAQMRVSDGARRRLGDIVFDLGVEHLGAGQDG